MEKFANLKSWPFVEAKRIFERITQSPPKKGYVLFETGYGPSGLPHLGTITEVYRTLIIKNALEHILKIEKTNIPTKLVCFSDDLDGLRKIPGNVPNQEMLADHLGRSLIHVPDPFGKYPSYAAQMNSRLRELLDMFGIEHEFCTASEFHMSGKFDDMMVQILEKYDQIMDIMLPTFREERKKTYSPIMPICPLTEKVLEVPIVEVNAISKTVVYQDLDGTYKEISVTNGQCKPQWKVAFAMRWAYLEVDYEIQGKDHRHNYTLYARLCNEVFGKTPPLTFFYEMFLNEDGEKISKSKGKGLSLDEWLHYGPLEGLLLFIYNSPTRAKKLYYGVISQSTDDYISQNQQYHALDKDEQIGTPLYHIHHGNVPIINTYGLNYSLLLNLACACDAQDSAVLWRFIHAFIGDTITSNAFLDKLVCQVLAYYNDHVKSKKEYLAPNEEHTQILKNILHALSSVEESSCGEDIQKILYDIGKNSSYKENLRNYFSDLYQILLGQREGPRLGSFIRLLGINETINLIRSKLNIL